MKSFVDKMQAAQIGLGGIFLIIFLVTVVIQMACRYLSISAMWTGEVAQYSFIWAVFTGAGAMVHSKAHFAFASLQDGLKNERAKIILQLIIDIIMLVFAVLMLIYGIVAAKQFWSNKWIAFPTISRGPTWLCIPFCGLTSTIYLLYSIYEDFGKLKKGGNA